MPSWLLPAASVGMILTGLAMLWMTWLRRWPRYKLFMAAGSILGGLAWFLPSEAAGAVLWMAAGASSLTGFLLLAVPTWRNAKTGHAPSGVDR